MTEIQTPTPDTTMNDQDDNPFVGQAGSLSREEAIAQRDAKLEARNVPLTPAEERKQDRDRMFSDIAKTSAVAIVGGASILGGTVIATQVAPHVEDLVAPDSVVQEATVELAQGGNLLPALDETAHALVLEANLPDAANINWDSLNDRVSESASQMGGVNIQPGEVGTLQLVDLGGTYTFEFTPDPSHIVEQTADAADNQN